MDLRTLGMRTPRLEGLFGPFTFMIFFMFAGIFAAAQSSPQANPSPQAQENVQAIKNVLQQQVAAWNRGDIPAFMDGYWKSDDLEFVNAAGIFQGWQDVLKRYQHSYPDRAAMGHLTFSGVEIHTLCPDIGFVVGHFRLDRKLDTEKDGQKDHPEGVFTLIFRKFPTGWKIINDHTTEFPTPPPPKNLRATIPCHLVFQEWASGAETGHLEKRYTSAPFCARLPPRETLEPRLRNVLYASSANSFGGRNQSWRQQRRLCPKLLSSTLAHSAE